MHPQLTDEQRRRLVETIVRRTLERLARENASGGSTTGALAIPCAIPPPGTPRHAEVLAALDLEAGAEGEGGGAPRTVHPGAAAIAPELLFLEREARAHHVEAACRAARALGAASLAVPPEHVGLASRLLSSTDSRAPRTRTAVVVGHPAASVSAVAKAEAARRAIAEGADEVQWVPSLDGVIRGDLRALLEELLVARGAMQGRSLLVAIASGSLPTARLLATVAVVAASGARSLRLALLGDPVPARADALVRAFLRGETADPAAGSAPGSSAGSEFAANPASLPNPATAPNPPSEFAFATESLARDGFRLLRAAPSIELSRPSPAGSLGASRC